MELLFKDKTKRTAHVSRQDPDSVKELERKKKESKDPKYWEAQGGRKRKENYEEPESGLILSGAVTIGHVLSDNEFRRICIPNRGPKKRRPLCSSDSEEEEQPLPSASPPRMKLRPRAGDFTYNEYLLIDLYRSVAFYREMETHNNGSGPGDVGRKRKKIVPTRKWNESAVMFQATERGKRGRSLHWGRFLMDHLNLSVVAPVSYFKQAPLSGIWEDIATPGLVIELLNPFAKDEEEIYWIGTIVHFAGYLALVKLDAFPDSSEIDAGANNESFLCWISFCSDVPKPLGWAKTAGKRMSPPGAENLNSDEAIIDQHLNKYRLQGNLKSISPQHHSMLSREIVKSTKRWPPAIPVETVDLENISETRLGRISAQIGNFVHVAFFQDNTGGEGFWVNSNSRELIHPFGWSNAVGVKLNGVPPNVPSQYSKLLDDDDEFKESLPPAPFEIEEGMKLEMRHPVLTFKIVGAVVTKVLDLGHFIVQTKENCRATRVQAVVHFGSPFILPWGWFQGRGVSVDFSKSVEIVDKILPLESLPPRPAHKFLRGIKVEAVDVLKANFCSAATIQSVEGHLLLLHWDDTSFVPANTFWEDAEQGNIYPLGYAQLVGFKFMKPKKVSIKRTLD